jgi:hypothetical protein
MKDVVVYRAQDIGDRKVEPVRITIGEPIPNMPFVDESVRNFEEDATVLFMALRSSLPGGTIDRLIGKLLAYKATHFVVNFDA